MWRTPNDQTEAEFAPGLNGKHPAATTCLQNNAQGWVDHTLQKPSAQDPRSRVPAGSSLVTLPGRPAGIRPSGHGSIQLALNGGAANGLASSQLYSRYVQKQNKQRSASKCKCARAIMNNVSRSQISRIDTIVILRRQT